MTEEAFYLDPHFWAAVAFVVFIVAAFRPASQALNRALDTRSAQIAAELNEAKRLREEAQSLLAEYQKKQRESLAEAERILAGTREDAKRLGEEAEAELKLAMEKRSKLAMEKIKQAETKALQEVQTHLVDIAIAAARTLIQEHLTRGGSDELIRQAASELERKLH